MKPLLFLLCASLAFAQKAVDPRIPQDAAAFGLTLDANPAKQTVVEIGDNSKDSLTPRMAVALWADAKNPNGEVSVALTLADDAPDAGAAFTKGDAVEWERAGRIARMYQKVQSDGSKAMEFEVEYATEPASNVVTWTIETSGLDFFRQPPLTDEIHVGDVLFGFKIATVTATEARDAAGTLVTGRPDNIVGSYAVYHSTKRDNIVGGKEYGPGKAFHLYRPEAIDANGARTWCDLAIDAKAGTLTITVPQPFLDTATYPVIVDPTFGYTTAGASVQTLTSLITWCLFTTPAGSGAISKITSSMSISSGTAPVSAAVYSSSASLPNTKLAEDSGSVTISGGTQTWYDNLLTYTFNSATNSTLWLAHWDNSLLVSEYFDSGAANQEQYQAGNTFRTWPSPAGAPTGNLSRKVSIYATYTVPSSTGNFFLLFP